MPGRGPASISRTRPWAVRWSASAVSSAPSRPSRFISYTAKMTRQCGEWALTSRVVRALLELGPPQARVLILPLKTLSLGMPWPARRRAGSRRPAQGRSKGRGWCRLLRPGLRAGSRDRHGLMAGRALHGPRTRGTRPRSASDAQGLAAWEGQSGPAYLDDLWGGVSSQPCVSWRRARRTSLDVDHCPTCRPGLLILDESACRVVPAVGCEQQLRSGNSAGYAARRRECLVAHSALTGRITPSWLLSRRLRLRT